MKPTAVPPLPPHEVHVWKISLEGDDARVRQLRQFLDGDELARADRFAFDHLRRRFIISHAGARMVLGSIAGRDPAMLRFEIGPHGKPSLIDCADVTFSLSHSGELALVAVARGRQLGVDIERTERKMPEDKFVERFFSPGEVARYLSLPADQRVEAFFNCWTRKEAYIKARGEGLSRPLDSFDVSLAPGDPPALLSVKDVPGEPARWRMHSLDAGPDYAAALIAEGGDWKLKLWMWE